MKREHLNLLAGAITDLQAAEAKLREIPELQVVADLVGGIVGTDRSTSQNPHGLLAIAAEQVMCGGHGYGLATFGVTQN